MATSSSSGSGTCVVCRCEDVTREEIESLLAEGLTDPEDLKRLTRAGMGHCQGKTCRSLVMGLVASRGLRFEDQARPSVRQPSRPVALGVLARDDAEDRLPEDQESPREQREEGNRVR